MVASNGSSTPASRANSLFSAMTYESCQVYVPRNVRCRSRQIEWNLYAAVVLSSNVQLFKRLENPLCIHVIKASVLCLQASRET